MTNKEIEAYLLQSLNMSLSINNETSYVNSFNVDVTDDGFHFIPRLPASFIINDELYQKIYMIANASLYPRYTVLKQNATYFVARNTDNIHIQRALFFPWIKGISERIVTDDPQSLIDRKNPNNIRIMKSFSIDITKISSILISGTSGSGKSEFTSYLLTMLKPISELFIIDLKFDSPSRWAAANNVKYLAPSRESSKSDFVAQVNEILSTHLNLIHDRQRILFENPETVFKPHFIVIEEILALSSDVNKAIKESFFSLINQIALLGRGPKIHLLIVSQRLSHDAYPVSARQNANLCILLGNINNATTQFLFPDLDPSGIVIPNGIGTGLIQMIDSEHRSRIIPLLTPTILKKESD